MRGMEIRPERRDDHDAVAALHIAAFGDHGVRVVGLLNDLRVAPDAMSLVAERDGDIAGHALFSRGWIDALPRLVEVAILSPVAVLPRQQGGGVGSALIRRGLQLLDELGVPAVFLEGSPQYYGRLGFERAAGAGFHKPSLRIPDEGFQIVRLGRYEPWMTGTVVYGDAFWRHDLVGLRD
jgi:putative acetyltransferase